MLWLCRAALNKFTEAINVVLKIYFSNQTQVTITISMKYCLDTFSTEYITFGIKYL